MEIGIVDWWFILGGTAMVMTLGALNDHLRGPTSGIGLAIIAGAFWTLHFIKLRKLIRMEDD